VLDNLRLQLSPCRQACPIGMNCQGYIRQIARGKNEDGLEKIREGAPFGGILSRVCSRPCEAKCNRTRVDGQALAIRDLKRFLTDSGPAMKPPAIQEIPQKVAIVGAGPAGLTAAYYLRASGFKVTLYDKEPAPGGLLRWALPEFRLPREVLDRDLAILPAVGVEFQANRNLGKDLRLEDLEEKFDAVILAVGCYGRVRLDVPGEDSANVFPALEFMKRVREKQPPEIGERAVVVGGGNAAVDAAQTALRLGAKKVHLISLEKREEMPAFAWSVAEAEEEGVAIQNGWGPKEFRVQGGKLKGVTFKKCAAVCDSEGCFCPSYDEKTTMNLPADTIILAIGQKLDNSLLAPLMGGSSGLPFDPITFQTKKAKILVAGDLSRGPKSIVDAMAQGKEAALSVKRLLTGEDLYYERENGKPYELQFEPDWNRAKKQARVAMPQIPLSRRKGFQEVAKGYSKEEALSEAERCLNCGIPVGLRTEKGEMAKRGKGERG
ncbi:MAG: 4Fe-4S ferredoxin, iron-sulfur binding, partial [Deltaproteobacteria bacterium]|nr:4Fe-4S ferredoxin, iron-sulfur binding [Deltaproteobacteria bacterium]